jgi:hypothetical protein
VWIERRTPPRAGVTSHGFVDFLPKTFDVGNVGRIAVEFIPRLAYTKVFPLAPRITSGS